MANKNIYYHPISSSYIPNDVSNLINSAKKSKIIGNLDQIYLDATQNDGYTDSFELNLKGVSAGEIFNLYQKLILNSQWDCRDNGDYQTIVLGREYMFYNVDDKLLTLNTSDDKQSIEREIKFTIIATDPIDFFYQINNLMINDGITNVYDEGTILKYGIDQPKKEYNNLKRMMERNKCRKFSENHFAISGFNLITHSIKLNSNVPNTVSEVFKKDEKNTISILGDVDEQYISEIIVTPEAPSSSVFSHEENEHRSDEYLANKLLEELRYTYQGNIIIKFNPEIEIGDTITLFDDVTSTFGIFQIDSYEHSLDQRGLITSLIVRASVELKDPVLDCHSQDIGYTLLKKFIDNFGSYDFTTSQKKIHRLMSVYLKTLVQYPKYCTFYSKKQKSFLNPTTVRCENIVSPTALPIRFFPMYIKGVQQIPQSLKYVFVSNDDNGFQNLFSKIFAQIGESLKNFSKNLIVKSWSIIYFISDIIVSTVTFNMSELLKPLIGTTENDAKKKTFDEVSKMNQDDVSGMVYYNPYEKKYKLMYNSYDYVFGFFNVRLQSRNDLYAANKLIEKNETNDINFLNRKIQTINKLMSDVFDTLFLVELYDGFNISVDNKRYGMNDFLKECTAAHNVDLEYVEKIMTNNYGSEYGAVITRNNSNLLNVSKNNCKTIELSNGRKAIEVTIDVSELNIDHKPIIEHVNENNYNDKSMQYVIKTNVRMQKIIFVFFHNLYGTTMEDRGESSVKERRENVKIVLDSYRQYVDGGDVGVIIMADFNLNVYNWSLGEKPYDGTADDNNFIYKLENDDFIAQIKSPTTLNQYGFLTGNQYDNVLISKNLYGKVSAKVFEYPEKDKLTISDHVPVYIGIKKMQE